MTRAVFNVSQINIFSRHLGSCIIAIFHIQSLKIEIIFVIVINLFSIMLIILSYIQVSFSSISFVLLC